MISHSAACVRSQNHLNPTNYPQERSMSGEQPLKLIGTNVQRSPSSTVCNSVDIIDTDLNWD